MAYFQLDVIRKNYLQFELLFESEDSAYAVQNYILKKYKNLNDVPKKYKALIERFILEYGDNNHYIRADLYIESFYDYDVEEFLKDIKADLE